MLLFDSGDPGGDRLIKNIYENFRVENKCLYVGINKRNYDQCDDFSNINLQGPNEIKSYIFSSSVHNKSYISRIRLLKNFNILTVHILDSWSNYLARFVHPDGYVILPDLYLLPDKFSYDEAVQAGIPKNILRVTGNALFSNLAFSKKPFENVLKILFVSEPADIDSQANPSNFRYNQFDVFDHLMDCLHLEQSDYTMGARVFIKSHPREDFVKWSEYLKCYESGVNLLDKKSISVDDFDIVCGVNSILLYEAWLKGKLVLVPSKYVDISHMRARSGVITEFPKSTGQNKKLSEISKNSAASEHRVHKNATKKIHNTIFKTLKLERFKNE